jgi:hypothetical protein
MKFILPLICLLNLACAPFEPKLTFPTTPLQSRDNETWYDVNHDGKPDFAIKTDTASSGTSLLYDDNEDGHPDRIYHLKDYANETVPHAILLLDSIPFKVMQDRYNRGDFPWFGPPIKVIAPFPSMTEICYTQVLHAPPLPAMTDEYYDAGAQEIHAGFSERIWGKRQPWERRLAYTATFFEASLVYLNPSAWLPIEMERMRRAIEESPDRVTAVYAVTASGMACKFGRPGIDDTLDAAKQLCLQLLYEHHGAIKISMMADHGHNLVESRSAQRSLESAIEAATVPNSTSKFKLTSILKTDADVVVELAALVTYVGLRTVHPAEVAKAVTTAKEVELAAYLQGNSVIVRNAKGSAQIDFKEGSFRYQVIDYDVLEYQPLLANLKQSRDGFATDRAWFEATKDHRYPDAPKRLWDAFHNMVKSPPDIMITLNDGYYAGKASLERFIAMKSTHGGLNQQNTATFVMTMTGRTATTAPAPKVLRSSEVLQTIEPGYEPRVRD